MKRITAIAAALMLLLTACSSQTESSEDAPPTEIPVTLTNRMTETERARVSLHALTLLDEPEPDAAPESSSEEPQEHTVGVEFVTLTPQQQFENLEKMRESLTAEEFAQAEKEMRPVIEAGKDVRYAAFILVDGKLVTDYIPYSDADYDGGAFSYTDTAVELETQQQTREEHTFESFDEYCAWLVQRNTEMGHTQEWIDRNLAHVKLAAEALKTDNYETLPEGTVDPEDMSLYDLDVPDEKTDYRDVWEFDRAEVEAIKDSVDEISIYDEELDTEFLVHVTRPPHYDPAETYPVLFLTDGVWRFGNVPTLRKYMENGEAADVLLVTLGFAYSLDGTDLGFRGTMLVNERYKLLDFITDNLMPYLGEHYHIDYENSALYGHSDGGVFAHTALCKSDLYDNQPFGKYLIGSPAFWGLYSDTPGQHPEDYEADYGYFQRQASVSKTVFLCAGALEDPDYADSYNGHPTTLEGTAALKERLEASGCDLTYKLYDSHHYQYIPEMLTEYLKMTYPPKN